MTVRYSKAIATVRCGGFLKLLWRWEGSIYKLVWFELSIFLGIYAALSISYHLLMNEPSKRTFENIAQYCNKFSDLIPISFVLGFYVQRVISRFWEQFYLIPWPNRMAIYVSTYIQSNDERGRLMRRTIMRYVCLGFVMTMASISPQIKKRFPTLTHITEAGFLLANEQQNLENMKIPNNKYFVPFIWATSVVARARKEGKIKSDIAMQKLLSELNEFRGGCASLFNYDWVSIPLGYTQEVNEFRGGCGGLFNYDWVSIPLGYTQVVTLAVYIFCLACLLGRYQFEVGDPAEKHLPFFTILQFVFYMGWLKVAESGLGPFGEDDDDFDINLLVDRYLHESYLVVDEMFMKAPDILRDQHWDLVDFDLPYTAASAATKRHIFLGSATATEVSAEKQAFVPIEVSHTDLKKTSSHALMSTHNLRGKKAYKLRRKSTFAEATESQESVVVTHGGAANVKRVETAPKPPTQEEQMPNAAIGKQSVELKPSTRAGEQPRASGGQQPSTSDGMQPSTDVIGNQSVEIKPSTAAGEQPRASGGQQPSTSEGTAVSQPEVLTQQETNLIAKIQDELKELRSK